MTTSRGGGGKVRSKATGGLGDTEHRPGPPGRGAGRPPHGPIRGMRWSPGPRGTLSNTPENAGRRGGARIYIFFAREMAFAFYINPGIPGPLMISNQEIEQNGGGAQTVEFGHQNRSHLRMRGHRKYSTNTNPGRGIVTHRKDGVDVAAALVAPVGVRLQQRLGQRALVDEAEALRRGREVQQQGIKRDACPDNVLYTINKQM